MNPAHDFAHSQHGFVLIFALVILVTLTLLGFIASRTAVIELTLSSNERAQRQAFSLADGGTDAATSILQENIDYIGVPASRQGNNYGALWYKPSAVLDANTMYNYNRPLPAAAVASLPPLRDSNAYPEIIRHLCIGGQGISSQVGSTNGCNPAADNGAPHTNILYNWDPNGQSSSSIDGNSDVASGTNPGGPVPASTTNVNIYAQHVAYQNNSPPAQATVKREGILNILWAQKASSVVNDSTNGPLAQ